MGRQNIAADAQGAGIHGREELVLGTARRGDGRYSCLSAAGVIVQADAGEAAECARGVESGGTSPSAASFKGRQSHAWTHEVEPDYMLGGSSIRFQT